MSEDRNEAGQFSSAEPLYGLAGVEADAGYISRPDASAQEPETYGSDEESLRALALKKFGDRSNNLVKIEKVFTDTGEPVPENLAQTTEQAASDLSNLHQWQKTEFENDGILKIAKEVDKARAEKIKADPKNADHYGLDAAETLARAEEADGAGPKAESTSTDDTEPYVAPKDGELHPEVEKALKHPQVREALEQEFTKADSVREQYTTGLEQARIASLATLAEVVPHLAGLDPSRFEEGLAALSQVDPPAFQQAMNILGRTHQIVQAQQAAQQHQAEVARQNFDAYAKAEDAKFRSMVNMPPAKMAEVGTEMVAYASELGIERGQLVHLLQTEPIMRHAAFQKMIYDAVQYRMLKAAPAKAAPKPVPTVVKPGVVHSKEGRTNESTGVLRDKLSSSGSVEDAFKLYQSKRKRG